MIYVFIISPYENTLKYFCFYVLEYQILLSYLTAISRVLRLAALVAVVLGAAVSDLVLAFRMFVDSSNRLQRFTSSN